MCVTNTSFSMPRSILVKFQMIILVCPYAIPLIDYATGCYGPCLWFDTTVDLAFRFSQISLKA